MRDEIIKLAEEAHKELMELRESIKGAAERLDTTCLLLYTKDMLRAEGQIQACDALLAQIKKD